MLGFGHIATFLTLGRIWLGTLLRRTLPKHHLNGHAKDVVRLGVGLIATIAALVLGLLIGAAKGSFDTQTTQLCISAGLSFPKIPSGLDSHRKAESSHH